MIGPLITLALAVASAAAQEATTLPGPVTPVEAGVTVASAVVGAPAGTAATTAATGSPLEVETATQAPEPVELPPPLVGLNQLFADPLDHVGRRVRVVFQVQSKPEHWNPFITRFGTADWAAVTVWAEHQFLWDYREYEHPLGNLFAPRGSAAHEVLDGASEFARFEATIRVDQVFLGRPWASIEALTPLRAQTGRGTILHAGRALGLMASGEWRLALDDLARADVPDLPAAAKTELERLVAFCEDRLTELRARNQSRGR